jgi:glycosyltransferase XagB
VQGDGSANDLAADVMAKTERWPDFSRRRSAHTALPATVPMDLSSRLSSVPEPELLRSAQVIAEFGFLFSIGITPEDVTRAAEQARALDVPPQSVMIAQGLVSPAAYVKAMGAAWDVPVITSQFEPSLALRASWLRTCLSLRQDPPHGLQPPDALLEAGGHRWLVLDGLARRPRDTRVIVRHMTQHDIFPALTTPNVLHETVIRELSDVIAHRAVHHLRITDSQASAARGLTTAQLLALAGLPSLFAGAALVVSTQAWSAVLALLSVPFLIAAAVRFAALAHTLTAATLTEAPDIDAVTDDCLPIYTVLVPLFREAAVLPGLVQALSRLDYPHVKLDIKLILEAIDAETLAAVAALNLGIPFDVIVVPDGQPRTKPRALNYALAFARGNYVCVFDAEDIPDPDQLRRAIAAFHAGPPELGCLQGRLTIDNGDVSWLSRQFAIEYFTLFDGFLPSLEAMHLPIPLGGTSNHFPIDVLHRVGGWDAHNVTEDADLGTRLKRRGFTVQMLPSRTYEEAPITLGAWIRQRTRWMKGYLQTWFVHMRRPATLYRELGLRCFLGFHAVIGGVVLSALVLPVFLAGLLLGSFHGSIGQMPVGPLALSFHGLSILNLVVGWTAPMLLSIAVIVRARRYDWLTSLPLQPVYWLLMSWAAWRAVFQLWHAPFTWEKTEHGVSRRRTARSRRLHQPNGRRRQRSSITP